MAMASSTLPTSFPIAAALRPHCPAGRRAVRAMTLDFSGSFFEAGGDDDGDPPSASSIALEDKEEPQCPPGLMQYETMAVLRPECRRTSGSLLPREMKGCSLPGEGCVWSLQQGSNTACLQPQEEEQGTSCLPILPN